MQPQFIKVPDSPQSTFLIRDMIVPYFSNPYHFHPELELTYIINSTGVRYIGDSIEPFGENDLVLVGSNLPHLWKNDKIYYEGDPDLKARAIVIQFREDMLGKEIWQLPEMIKAKNMITRSRQGLKIMNESKKDIVKLMQAMTCQSGAEQLVSLLSLLNKIAESKDTKTLTTKAFSVNLAEMGPERINAVFAYIFENFSEEITLKEIAEVANMSPTAFCRYFKAHTNKTFSLFVIETRIQHACKLILKEDLNLSDIAFKSGFNNSSYFTKQFKKIMGTTPFEYKKKFGNASS
jgi:AraC-like DNA-binding protein